MDFTLTFIKLFFFALYLAAPILLFLLLYIILVGQFVGRREEWGRFDSLYWSFVTATTLGYGDFRPTQKLTKALSVSMALTGVVFTGIIVALAVHSATEAFKNYSDVEKIKSGIERIID